MVSPPGVGQITGWADYRYALDGHPAFVTRLEMATDGEDEEYMKMKFSESTKPAIVEGHEYFWSSQGVTASFLWRTHGDFETMSGNSGSVLCLGDPSDREVKAVVFQNYETPVKK